MRLIIQEEAESTQDLAREWAVRGEPEGLAVMALNQTKGRGMAGHSWVSPPGKNLALSMILRPRFSPEKAPLLGLLASIAVAETVESRIRMPAQLKWPNDVLVDGRKIAGILPEASLNGRQIGFVIVGIGLNVNAELSDFPPDLRDCVTSLRLSAGRELDLEDTARDLLERTELLYERAKGEGCSFIPGLWDARWAHRGAKFTRNGLAYTAEAIDADGELLVRAESGESQRLNSGSSELVWPDLRTGSRAVR
jgi:BirA family transcriptional regulator, biotin operon repressor / biotin---[acetyl-CoA-carboxylase] ligase